MSSDNGVADSDELTGLSEDGSAGDLRVEGVAAAEAALAVDPEVEVASKDTDDADEPAEAVADDDAEDAEDAEDAGADDEA